MLHPLHEMFRQLFPDRPCNGPRSEIHQDLIRERVENIYKTRMFHHEEKWDGVVILDSCDKSLFGMIRRQLLCLFFLNPGRSYFLLELVDILRTGRGGVQRELANLVDSGIIKLEGLLEQTFPILDSIRKHPYTSVRNQC